MGEIELIIGPMFSGKTTELQRRLKRYQIAKYKCLVIKYAGDTRYDSDHSDRGEEDDEERTGEEKPRIVDEREPPVVRRHQRLRTAKLYTHDKQRMDAVAALELAPLLKMASAYHVVGIDEGQFFPDLVPFAERLATDHGVVVIVAALNATYLRRGFPVVVELVPKSERVTKLSAVCQSCFGDASFTWRHIDESDTDLIGGIDKYKAVCRACHAEERNNKEQAQ